MTPDLCARTIAYNIRAELVCCDAYERYRHNPDDAENAGHGLCYWGEAAALVALSTVQGSRHARIVPNRIDWLTLDVK